MKGAGLQAKEADLDCSALIRADVGIIALVRLRDAPSGQGGVDASSSRAIRVVTTDDLADTITRRLVAVEVVESLRLSA